MGQKKEAIKGCNQISSEKPLRDCKGPGGKAVAARKPKNITELVCRPLLMRNWLRFLRNTAGS